MVDQIRQKMAPFMPAMNTIVATLILAVMFYASDAVHDAATAIEKLRDETRIKDVRHSQDIALLKQELIQIRRENDIWRGQLGVILNDRQ